MSDTTSDSHAPVSDDGDEFEAYLAKAKEKPEFRAALEDAEELNDVIDALVALRRELGLTQKEIAKRMGVRQPAVSGFETEGSDPRLSTLQRYARAVEGRLRLFVARPSDCDWLPSSTRSYSSRTTLVASEPSVQSGQLARDWDKESKAKHSDWELVA